MQLAEVMYSECYFVLCNAEIKHSTAFTSLYTNTTSPQTLLVSYIIVLPQTLTPAGWYI